MINPYPEIPFFSEDCSVLKKPLAVGLKAAPDRLVCQPMEGCDGTADGRPGELTLRKYQRLAAGGSGLIWVEATSISREARANPRQLWLTQENKESFKQLVELIHTSAEKAGFEKPLLILQVTHSGRYAKPDGTPKPIIAYHNPIFEKEPLPDNCIISDDELDAMPEKFAATARLAEECGFDGVDIKACHRYLLCELLSAFTRPGKYGGCLENRTRLLFDAMEAARQSCGSDFIVTSRINVYDGFPYPYGFGVNEDGGLEVDLAEPIQLIEKLQKSGVKLLNITMGNPYVNPHVNRPFKTGAYTPEEKATEGVRRMLENTAVLQKKFPDLPLICSGISYLAENAAHVAAGLIENGGAAMAGFGRLTLAYPDYAKDILREKSLERGKCCIACSKCSELMRAGSVAGCVVRDSEVYLPIYKRDVLKEGI
ncbi:MAG TPA: flavin oxidoreductase/NADH oxidase [Oscillospiraceae bacterium]|nr:flavin oxidoreductase/NADH oxidase [Oscillospiraceae bacterium]HPF54955.1 flavin oxidoreductase/NADH oxidase [Clostridiales bacterium]HPK34368.1 flavin oxidoreductase/NADH oxidase [Oscillospiraceae bacterium]HPR75814.1 flavin oxidoreductase/NADH oxidase [Oscillospiraceae bacterium]